VGSNWRELGFDWAIASILIAILLFGVVILFVLWMVFELAPQDEIQAHRIQSVLE
jgi:hypothetical protein